MKKLSILTVASAAIVLLLLSVSMDGFSQSEARVKQIVTKNNADFIRWFNGGQLDSLLTSYSDEACILGQGCGKSFIRSYYQSQMDLFQFEELTISSLTVSKSIAVESGRFKVRFSSGQTLGGEYLTEWRRKNRKTWEILTESSTPD